MLEVEAKGMSVVKRTDAVDGRRCVRERERQRRKKKKKKRVMGERSGGRRRVFKTSGKRVKRRR